MLFRQTGVPVIQLSVIALAVALGCDSRREDETSAMRLDIDTDSLGAVPGQVRTIALAAAATLPENSGATMSASQPGIVFTINDSGHDPVLFALDTTGALRGR